MNGAGKKHTLKFDPRTELLLLVLANRAMVFQYKEGIGAEIHIK